MSSRSLNRVMLIGNLTRDPELRYTPNGTAVVTFGIATNRSWLPEGAQERREETEFHRIVAWNKLADLCAQLLYRGCKVYVEGRLSTRSWNAQDGTQHTATEIVIDDMIILDKKGDRALRAEAANYASAADTNPAAASTAGAAPTATTGQQQASVGDDQTAGNTAKSNNTQQEEAQEKADEETTKKNDENLNPEDIPF